MDARTGQRHRIDAISSDMALVVQGVDAEWSPSLGRVTHWMHSGHKPVYRLTLRNGATIKATADHRFLTELGWHPLSDLAVGDYVATPLALVTE
jgi:replicative DNA helicase